MDERSRSQCETLVSDHQAEPACIMVLPVWLASLSPSLCSVGCITLSHDPIIHCPSLIMAYLSGVPALSWVNSLEPIPHGRQWQASRKARRHQIIRDMAPAHTKQVQGLVCRLWEGLWQPRRQGAYCWQKGDCMGRMDDLLYYHQHATNSNHSEGDTIRPRPAGHPWHVTSLNPTEQERHYR